MGRGILSEEERRILLKNPYIRAVNDKRISYADEFKVHFIKEYQTGKGPQQIFKEAGLDVAILGSKRIERAAARWREAAREATVCKNSAVIRYTAAERSAREKNLQEQIAEQAREIALLKEQIKLLYENYNKNNST